MLTIPVLDLRAGRVVRAMGGLRDRYQPMTSALCPSPVPGRVIEAYRTLYPFPIFYIADLDAIEHTGNNRPAVDELLAAFPDAVFWLDAGFAHAQELATLSNSPRCRPVLGSESHHQVDTLVALMQAWKERDPILSLDFRHERLLGPSELLINPELWPQDVILMRLDRVGTGHGPGDDALQARVRWEGRRYYAAGGVRDGSDLIRLAQLGYAGVLVASALHDRKVAHSEIEAAMRITETFSHAPSWRAGDKDKG
ncbi:MAG: HisA/HisF-related TIM barrel protein [Gammaproteobacteria bacterium]